MLLERGIWIGKRGRSRHTVSHHPRVLDIQLFDINYPSHKHAECTHLQVRRSSRRRLGFGGWRLGHGKLPRFQRLVSPPHLVLLSSSTQLLEDTKLDARVSSNVTRMERSAGRHEVCQVLRLTRMFLSHGGELYMESSKVLSYIPRE